MLIGNVKQGLCIIECLTNQKPTTSSMTLSTIWAQDSQRDVIGSEIQRWLYPCWVGDGVFFCFIFLLGKSGRICTVSGLTPPHDCFFNLIVLLVKISEQRLSKSIHFSICCLLKLEPAHFIYCRKRPTVFLHGSNSTRPKGPWLEHTMRSESIVF